VTCDIALLSLFFRIDVSLLTAKLSGRVGCAGLEENVQLATKEMAERACNGHGFVHNKSPNVFFYSLSLSLSHLAPIIIHFLALIDAFLVAKSL
jgi:hypothetical protein